ncbi:nitroreductase/quinone reductase family protein [Mycobacterium sp. E3305]|uniref:nitroreductase/quinone reductase family protein n=1 Tax=Mycobacterium sp. E3305 TaxID=1834145 RepID=UPI000B154139|nr:nitroreductase/quinone reductase family protein [Mycobacterium sp. E3305]
MDGPRHPHRHLRPVTFPSLQVEKDPGDVVDADVGEAAGTEQLDGERVILPASFGGRDEDPLWYRILKEHPEVRVQIRDRQLDLVARDATDAERERYWPPLKRICPRYRKYRRAIDRVIPLVVCEPC